MVKITIDPRRAIKKLNKVQLQITGKSEKTVRDVGEAIKTVAKTIAPKSTGKTANLIAAYYKKTPAGYAAQIVARNPTKGGRNRMSTGGRYGGNFNLVRWMHETGGIFQTDNKFLLAITNGRQGRAGTKHIRSGDPYFMYTAGRQAREDASRIIKNNFRGLGK